MNAPDLQTIELNVLLLRKHAARVFLLWAGEWNAVVNPHVASEYSHTLAAVIQMTYWDVFRRNPTVHEWVDNFMRYADGSKSDIDIRTGIAEQSGYREDTLNRNKPFWAMYQMAGYDAMKAAQLYSEEVGRAFLSARPFDVDALTITQTFKDLDLTKAPSIHKVVKGVGYRRPWWKRWLPVRKVKW